MLQARHPISVRSARVLSALFVVFFAGASVARAQAWSVERSADHTAIAARYEEVLSSSPLSRYALDGLVREYAALGGLEALLERYARRVSRAPEDRSALLVLAQLRERAGQQEAALTLVDRAVELGAGDSGAWVLRGRLRARTGDRVGAAADYETALERARDTADRIEILRLLGGLYLSSGEPLLAVEAFQRIAEVAPRDRYVRLELAHLLYEAGFVDEGLQRLFEAAELAGSNTRERADALREAATLQEELGRYEAAAETWRGVRSLTRAGSWLAEVAEEGLVRCYRAAGQLDVLLSQVEAELAPRTRDRFLLATRARILNELGRSDESVAAYRLALERLRGDRQLALELAGLLVSVDRVGEARELLEETLAARPDDFEVLTELAALLVERGELFDASFLLRNYQERHWRGVSELWQLFRVYQRIGDRSAADRVATRILELSPDDQRPLLQMADAAFVDGRVAEGLATLSTVQVEGDPALQLDVIELLRRHDRQAEADAELWAARDRFPRDESIAALWMQSVRYQGSERALLAAREVLQLADRWDVVVDAFDLYWTLLVEARLVDWAVGHYQSRLDRRPRDYRSGRTLLMLRIAAGDVGGASRTLSAIRAVAPRSEQVEEWVLATMRRWPNPAALPLLRRLGASESSGRWRFQVIEARALADAGRTAEARALLEDLEASVADTPAALFAVAEAYRASSDRIDREHGCALVTRALASEPRNESFRLTAVDCLAQLGKGSAAFDLVMEGLAMVREEVVADALWERLLALRPTDVAVAELAERLRADFAGRRPVLREWLEVRLRELGSAI